MRENLLIGLLLCLSFNLLAQKVVEDPYIEANNTGAFFIDKVILNEDATLLECTMNGIKGQWFSIPDKTFLRAEGSKEKLYVKSMTEPYEVNKSITPDKTGPINFTLTFPPLPAETKKVDYIEGNKGGNWRLLGIHLSNEPRLDYISNAYCGHWFNNDGSNEWIIGFIKDEVIYKGENYKTFDCKESSKGYQLTIANEQLDLRVKDGKLFIKDSDGHPIVCSKVKHYNKDYKPTKATMPEVVFEEKEAVLSGCLDNYNPSIGKTATVYVNNIMTGEQVPHLIKINENGTFSVKIELAFPQFVFMRFPNANTSAVLVPGKELKMLVKRGQASYIGEYAQFNKMLNSFSRIRSYDYKKVRKEIETMTTDDYKAYCDGVYEKNLDRFDNMVKNQNLSTELESFGKLSLKMRYTEQLLNFHSQKRSLKYKLMKEGKSLNYEEPGNDYYQFLGDLSWDDTRMLMAPGFSSLINRLKFTNYMFKSSPTGTKDIVNYLESIGKSLTPEEQKIYDKQLAYDELDWVKEKGKIMDANKDMMQQYRVRYRELLRSYKNTSGKYYTELPQFFKENNVEASQEELEFFASLAKYETDEYQSVTEEYIDSEGVRKLYEKYRDVQFLMMKKKQIDHRNATLLSDFGTSTKLLADIMTSQDLCPSKKSPLPLNDYQKLAVESEINTPWVKEYILNANEKAIAKMEANKHAKGANINKVPETEAEKLFDEMVKPFRGKVVYVDFWATWCGPCLGGMQRVKPIKEELKENKDIVFMYITNHSSPEDKWKAIIADNKGEHYRLTQDEWNIISAQFGISGIPHYILVNKKGEVVINDRSIDPGYNLKDTLLKYANE